MVLVADQPMVSEGVMVKDWRMAAVSVPAGLRERVARAPRVRLTVLGYVSEGGGERVSVRVALGVGFMVGVELCDGGVVGDGVRVWV